MKTRPVCFVISPIGPEKSDILAKANDFLELLVEPALEKYHFEVVRADRIARPTFITNDIVQFVQQSELCIIDVTGGNPNVFYECGRRHEAGKPFIQLVDKEGLDRLPFDVAGIRTIPYDLSTPRSILACQQVIREFVDQLVATGFGTTTGGESLGSVAQSLHRIERKLEILTSTPRYSTLPMRADAGGENVDMHDFLGSLLLPPKIQFLNALRNGDTGAAHSALQKMKHSESAHEYIGAVGILAASGDKTAFMMLEEAIDDMLVHAENYDDDVSKIMFQMTSNYFTNTGKAVEGLRFLVDKFDAIQPMNNFSDDLKGFIANKGGMIAWIADKDDECLRLTVIATRYSPNEPSYFYNLALVEKKMGREADLRKTLNRLASLPGLDSDHLKLLKKHGVEPITKQGEQ
jgi:hypothetical protein